MRRRLPYSLARRCSFNVIEDKRRCLAMFRLGYGLVGFYCPDPPKKSTSLKQLHIVIKIWDLVCFFGFGVEQQSCLPGEPEPSRANERIA